MLTSFALHSWEAASLAAFVYSALTAVFLPGVASAVRVRAFGASMAGICITIASTLAPSNAIVHDWLLPPLLLFLFYWTTGLLFVAPMARLENTFVWIDAALNIRSWSSRAPVWLADTLELAYAGVFVLVPVALALYLCLGSAATADRFWTVILVTDFVCFGFLPWIQTRPPRALEAGEPWHSSLRSLNLGLLRATSVQVNTFPSGHAAEALAAALLVAALSPAVSLCMFLAALAVSAGAVFGRYHYAIDAFTGWFVAVAVWVLLG